MANRFVPKTLDEQQILDAFRDFIAPLRLAHFAADELLFLGASHERNKLNHLPPQGLWPNIVTTALIANQIRSIVGVPCRVLSGFRGDAYNRKIDGSPTSRHKAFAALDIEAAGLPPNHLFGVARGLRAAGTPFSWSPAGIGLYSWGIHIDWRVERDGTWEL